MPGILPRIKYLFQSGFSFLAGLIAVIYSNIGLLPKGHPYLLPDNYGRFGIRHVVAAAGNNLIFKRQHIDQIIMYFLILLGLALVAVQIVLFIVSFFSTPAIAGSLVAMFTTTPTGHTSVQDLAFRVLDSVFGIQQLSGDTGIGLPSFFESCISPTTPVCEDIEGNALNPYGAYPAPMHVALHQMLYFYTLGIAFLAGAIILYFVVAIIAETVTSGTPFGKRFNRAWFVPRLIVFFALIAPISSTGSNAGINVAQLGILTAAKYGSNMATNVWLNYNDAIVGGWTPNDPNYPTLMTEGRSLLAYLNVPETGGLTQFMHLVRLCIVAEKIINGIDVYPYVVRPTRTDTGSAQLHTGGTQAINAMGGTTEDYLDYYAGSANFENAVIFSRYKTVVLRFGHRNPPMISSFNPLTINLVGPSGVTNPPSGLIDNENFAPNQRLDAYNDWGYVEPTCGELHFKIASVDRHIIGPLVPGDGLFGIQENFYESIADYFGGFNSAADETVMCMVRSILPYDQNHDCVDQSYTVRNPFNAGVSTDPEFYFESPTKLLTMDAARADIEFFDAANDFYLNGILTDWAFRAPSSAPYTMAAIADAVDDGAYEGNLLMPSALRQRGWAAAPLWYNRIAELNGEVSSAMQNVPIVYRYPRVMEVIAEQHRLNDSNYSHTDRFNPRLQNGKMATLPRAGDQYLAALYYMDYKFWQQSDVQETVFTRSSSNAIIDFINSVFGTSGLIDVYDNKGAHPLAMLSAAGKTMVDASLTKLFIGVVGQGVGEWVSTTFIGKLGQLGGEFLVQFSLISLAIGFMLYYVLPFMPFIYFLFAFGGWIKSIFEAIVAMPLWAVAHIKIDGQGLPGPLATNGYFLIFEILLRPTLIIFGFLMSITLFIMLVDTLHELFEVLVFMATGYDITQELYPGAATGHMNPELFQPATTRFGDSMDYYRGPVDQLFYTVMYVVLVYMIGLSCFKLVDEIPNAIMRWMGVTVSTFQETAGDPAGQLSGTLYRSTQMANAQITTMIARMKGRDSRAVEEQAVIGAL